MLTIRLITINEKEHPIIEISDKFPSCCEAIFRELEDTKIKGNMLVLVEFSKGVRPSIAAIVVGCLAAKYEVVAVSEKDWDSFIVASTRNEFFPLGKEIS